MVATLLKLKLRLTVAELKRSVVRLVLWIVFCVYALFIIFAVLSGLVAASTTVRGHEALAQAVMIAVGTVVVLGWTFLPLAFFGSDQTLDPARFIPFPLTGKQLAPGLALAGVIGIPGLATFIICLGSSLPWLNTPVAIVAGLVGGVLGFVMAQLGCRIAAAWFSGALSSRKGRDRSSLVGLVIVLLLAVLIYSASLIVQWFTDNSERWQHLLDVLGPVGTVLSWLPLGAPWALAGDVAQGHWLLAAGHLVITMVYIGLGLWAYGKVLDKVLVAPPRAADSTKPAKGDAIARAASRSWATGKLAPVAVIVARCLRYWRRDPRYLGNIPMILVLPILFTIMGRVLNQAPTEGTGLPAFVTIGFAGFGLGLMAVMAGYSMSADVASDSTAWWIHLTSGVKGWQDRLGRILAEMVWALPLVIVVTVVVMVVFNSPGRIPAALGATLALYLTGLGVSSVASALIIYPVPLPGESPMRMRTGMMGSQMLSQFGSMIACGLLGLPVCIWALSAHGGVTWLVLLVGLVWGAIVLVAGVVLGGKIMDSRGPAIMQILIKNDTRVRA